MTSLTVLDIDDTLFTTSANIHVMTSGERTKSSTPSEFNEYSLEEGEQFDFSDFRSSVLFSESARPFPIMFRTAKRMMSYLDGKFIIITAREDMDDRDMFLDTFKKFGFPIERAHIHRVGNIKNLDAPLAKKMIVRRELKNGPYDTVRIFDDNLGMLARMSQLEYEFPYIKFEVFHVKANGVIERL